MSTIISSDKHYKELAIKIRKVLGTTVKYNSSEIASAITNMKDSLNKYSYITNGAIFSGETASIKGTKMYNGMFAGSNIKSFEVPENIIEIPDYAFYESKIKNIVLHDNITSIGKYAFCYCQNLVEISLPQNLISIGYMAFSDNWFEGNLVIPNSVVNIDEYAFRHNSFPSVDVGKNVTTIKVQAFANNDFLKTVIFRRTESVCSVGDIIFRNTPIANGSGYIYVPSALINSYKATTGFSEYANQFRPLEDYTVDGTVTGEFDYSKI